MKYIRYIAILTWSFLIGCEEPYDFPITPVTDDLLVVEGVFTNQIQNHLVRLTKTYNDINGTPIPASGATVAIFDADSAHFLTESPAGSGLYYSDSIAAVINKAYGLYIAYDGKEYTGFDIQVPVEPLEGPAYVQVETDQYALNLSTQGSNPNYVRNFVSWGQTSQCESVNDVCLAKVVNYDIKTIDVNEIFKPEKVNITFPAGTIIIRQKFSVSGGYQAFLRAMLSETEWRGGVFDVERANTLSNMSEGAIGYFALSSVVSDTTLVQ
jgi:hypothetical protein